MKTFKRNRPSLRGGSILLVVLVIIVLLSLAAYTFSELSLAENEATTMFGRGVLARSFAESGIDVAASVVADPVERIQSDSVLSHPDIFSGAIVKPSDAPRGRGRFSVIAPVSTDPSGQALRYGLIDESGKLNLNALLGFNLNNDTNNRNLLMNLPYMTFDLADAILDWIDPDDTPRQYGAESEYYQTLPQPYKAANGPLSSLDELLLVKGVTPALLYGEDVNRNGIQDPDEDVNHDGYFDRGWSAYLTIYSSERNLRADGSLRINVNQQDLPQLFDSVNSELGADAAKFIVSYRMNGSGAATTTRGGGGGGGTGGGSGGGNASGGGGGGRGTAAAASGNTVPRGGLMIPAPPATGKTTITSIYQLIGASTTATVNGKKQTLTSPWASSNDKVSQYLPDLLEKLTLTDNMFVPGRINVNQASIEVLLGLPSMTEDLARHIVGSQTAPGSSESTSNTLSPRATNAWLLIEGLTTLSVMQKLDPFLTGRGDVYRVQSVGYFDEGGPVVRLEAVIDATTQPPHILNLRDLSELGSGFTRQQLGVTP